MKRNQVSLANSTLNPGSECRKFKPVKISIVVPAFNEERLLGESLAQIRSAAGTFGGRGWGTESIVVRQ